MADGEVFASQTLHTLWADIGPLPGWGEMSEASAESVILALQKQNKQCFWQKERLFPQ